MSVSDEILRFESLQIDPVHRRLFLDGQQVRLTAKPFEALLFLTENRGRVVTREELRTSVWGGYHVTDAAIEQAINKIRKAVGERTGEPHFVHTIWGKGYMFSSKTTDVPISLGECHTSHQELVGGTTVATPLVQTETLSGTAGPLSRTSIGFIVSASILYAALFSIAIFVEVAYAFDRLGAAAIIVAAKVFPSVCAASIAALWIHRSKTQKGCQRGLPPLLLAFLCTAAIAFIFAIRVLPSKPVTMLLFQGFTARSAYLKDVGYFLIWAVFLMLVPFHFIQRMEYELREGRLEAARAMLMNRSVKGISWIVCPKPGILLGLLLGVLVWSLLSVARITENLRPSPFLDLYVEVLQIQRFVFFALGFQCLGWYYFKLRELEQALSL